MASILTGHVTHWACLGFSGSAYTTACSSSWQYPATSHSHWRGVDQHSSGHNQQPDQLYANGGHTRYWLVFWPIPPPPNTVKLHILEWPFIKWMMHLYSALLCIAVHQKLCIIMGRGSLLNHHQCAESTWMMRRLPQDNGTSVLTTRQLQVERRESHRAIKWMGIIRRLWLTRASGGNLARTPGFHP